MRTEHQAVEGHGLFEVLIKDVIGLGFGKDLKRTLFLPFEGHGFFHLLCAKGQREQKDIHSFIHRRSWQIHRFNILIRVFCPFVGFMKAYVFTFSLEQTFKLPGFSCDVVSFSKRKLCVTKNILQSTIAFETCL